MIDIMQPRDFASIAHYEPKPLVISSVALTASSLLLFSIDIIAKYKVEGIR